MLLQVLAASQAGLGDPARDRAARLTEIGGWLAAAPTGPVTAVEEERYLGLRLSTLTGPQLAGQVVFHIRVAVPRTRTRS